MNNKSAPKRVKKIIGNPSAVLADLRHSFRDSELRGLAFFAVVILAIGTCFYMAIEGWDFIEALYFCVTTLTTVGFGDLAPTSDLSRAFTILYTLLGIGFILSLLTVVARQANRPLVDRLRQRDQDRK